MREFYDYKSFITDHVKPLHALRQAHMIRIFKVRGIISTYLKVAVVLEFVNLHVFYVSNRATMIMFGSIQGNMSTVPGIPILC